jgi:ubiquinone/menaquinone biosynthesis C-methylase UbiE
MRARRTADRPPSVREARMTNAETWRATDVVGEYAAAAELQPPEKRLLETLADDLPAMRMLDLGVGGGRTAVHFAPRVREYIGLDYSAPMIEACRKRLAAEAAATRVSFIHGDARSMTEFPDGQFHFVLFSFNGIDYVSHRDRLRIFSEVRRVGQKGSLFFFSTHNLQYLESSGRRPFAVSRAVLNDGVHHGRLQTYYIRPSAQVIQLRAGFTDIVLYSVATGEPFPPGTDLDTIVEPWIYYLCRIHK